MTFYFNLHYFVTVMINKNIKTALDVPNNTAEILFNFFPYFLLKSSSFIIFTPYYFLLYDCWVLTVYQSQSVFIFSGAVSYTSTLFARIQSAGSIFNSKPYPASIRHSATGASGRP